MKPIEWREDHAVLIDQTRLPHVQEWVPCRTVDEYAEAIRSMKIRGAPAIGITAAYALARLDFPGRVPIFLLLIAGFAIPVHTVLVPL